MKKSYGQHFLRDQDVISLIIESANIQPDELIVEVGPGGGALTYHLALLPNPLILIEADRELIPGLQRKFPKATVVMGDAAQVNYDEITASKPWVFVSNLPYNAGNAILEQVFQASHSPRQLIVMVQKEVGERMMALPGEMSVLSIATQLYADVEWICDVDPAAFVPAPRVDSVVLKMVPIERNPNAEPIIALAKIGFAHRRKQLQRMLNDADIASEEKIDNAFKIIGLSKTVRPQELSLEQWVKLYEQLS